MVVILLPYANKYCFVIRDKLTNRQIDTVLQYCIRLGKTCEAAEMPEYQKTWYSRMTKNILTIK